MNKALDKQMAIIVIILFAGLMQIHSIRFWQDTAGQWSGVAFSLALEGAMLTLFYFGRGLFLWFVKYAAALVLISGPWYVMVTPALDELSKNMEIQDKIERAEMKVDRLRESKRTYDDNSTKFRQWGGRIDRTESKLETAERELEERYAEASGIGFEWRRHMVAGMAGSVLLIVMTAQLVLVSEIRPEPKDVSGENLKDLKKLKDISGKSKSASATKAALSEKDRAVLAVAKVLKAKLPEYGNIASAMAKEMGLSQKHVSQVSRYFENKRDGKETISNNALQTMMVTLGVKKGEY